MNKTVMCCW